MPLYLDFHIGQGLTAEDIALAHQLDVNIQDQFNCNCLTYWIDVERSNAYCLIQAPDKSAVIELHKNSHKQLPDEIIEVDRRIVKAFLGRIHDPKVVDYMIDQKIKVFNEPAFRVILIVETKDEVQLNQEFESAELKEQLVKYNTIIQNRIKRHQGVAAEIKGQEIIATFESAIQSMLCAIDIKNMLNSVAETIGLRMSIHAGNPVGVSSEIFGDALKLTRFLNVISNNGDLVVSSLVKDLLDKASEKSTASLGEIKYLSSTEEAFLTKFVDILHDNWQSIDFDIDAICGALSISKSKLYRQCVAIIGLSSNRILRRFRLIKAKQLLLTSKENIAQTAFETGFSSPSYFTKCFHKEFGILPIAYAKD